MLVRCRYYPHSSSSPTLAAFFHLPFLHVFDTDVHARLPVPVHAPHALCTSPFDVDGSPPLLNTLLSRSFHLPLVFDSIHNVFLHVADKSGSVACLTPCAVLVSVELGICRQSYSILSIEKICLSVMGLDIL